MVLQACACLCFGSLGLVLEVQRLSVSPYVDSRLRWSERSTCGLCRKGVEVKPLDCRQSGEQSEGVLDTSTFRGSCQSGRRRRLVVINGVPVSFVLSSKTGIALERCVLAGVEIVKALVVVLCHTSERLPPPMIR